MKGTRREQSGGEGLERGGEREEEDVMVGQGEVGESWGECRDRERGDKGKKRRRWYSTRVREGRVV